MGGRKITKNKKMRIIIYNISVTALNQVSISGFNVANQGSVVYLIVLKVFE